MLVACPKGVWTKVASGVTKGMVWVSRTDPTVFYHAYRAVGDSSPPDDQPFSIDGQARLTPPGVTISSDIPIDVYLYANDLDGTVRVDV